MNKSNTFRKGKNSDLNKRKKNPTLFIMRKNERPDCLSNEYYVDFTELDEILYKYFSENNNENNFWYNFFGFGKKFACGFRHEHFVKTGFQMNNSFLCKDVIDILSKYKHFDKKVVINDNKFVDRVYIVPTIENKKIEFTGNYCGAHLLDYNTPENSVIYVIRTYNNNNVPDGKQKKHLPYGYCWHRDTVPKMCRSRTAKKMNTLCFFKNEALNFDKDDEDDYDYDYDYKNENDYDCKDDFNI